MTRLKSKKALQGNSEDVRFGTHELVADYRAKRVAALKPTTIIEIGAGAGFQTKAFSKVAKKVIAIDVDKERMSMAEFADNVVVIIGDALDSAVLEKVKSEIEGTVDVFTDPERAPSVEHRTIGEIKPNIRLTLSNYKKLTDHIIIELPPQLSNDELDMLPAHEREYLSINGTLNRLTVYFGFAPCVSVIQLPRNTRLEATIYEPIREGPILEHYLLEPDMALIKAGLVGNALADQPVLIEDIGNKQVYIATKKSPSMLFRQRKILAHGNKALIQKRLISYDKVVLHGKLTPEEQRTLLFELRKFCKGKDTVHLFMGRRWFLTE